MANIHRDKNAKPDPWTEDDFLPKLVEASEVLEQSEPDDATIVLRKAIRLTAMLGGEVDPAIAGILEPARSETLQNDTRRPAVTNRAG